MYLKRMLRNFPEDYFYWNTTWFHQITKEYERYHYAILLTRCRRGVVSAHLMVSRSPVLKFDLMLNYAVRRGPSI